MGWESHKMDHLRISSCACTERPLQKPRGGSRKRSCSTQCFHNDLLADPEWIPLIPWMPRSHLPTTKITVTQNSSYNLLVGDYMLDTLHGPILWIVTTIWDSCYFHPHYTDEETGAQRIVIQTVGGNVRMLIWSQPQSETLTDLLLWEVGSTCSDKSYGTNSDLITPVLKM